jgi:hypothetical protein
MSGQFNVFKVLLAEYHFNWIVHGGRELVLGKLLLSHLREMKLIDSTTTTTI